MHLRVRRAAATAATLTIVASSITAFAAVTNFYADTRKATTTAASGHSGYDMKLELQGSFLRSISWSERNDNPCFFRVEGAYVENGKWVAGKAETQPNGVFCEAHGTSMQSVSLLPPGVAMGDGLNNGRFIRAVRVCSSEKSSSAAEKLKGIRVKSATLQPNGTLTADDSTEDYARPNCKTWEQEVACPTGQAATGIVVQYDAKGATGLRLQCAPVSLTKPRPASAGQ